MKNLGILEGLLFVVGDDGVTLESICEILEINEEEAKNLLKMLKNKYEKEDSGIMISYLADAFKLTTKPEHKNYYKKLIVRSESNTLSASQLETLAVIAYNGPITRAEIDEIRGVSTTYSLNKLLAKDLVKVDSKSELPGRPNLYVVTNQFLDYFGLATLKDLPVITKNDEVAESLELYNTIFKEEE